MKVIFSSSVVFLLVFFSLSCEKNDEVIPQDPTNPMVEQRVDTLITSNGIQFVRTPDQYFQAGDRSRSKVEPDYSHCAVDFSGFLANLHGSRSACLPDNL